jgi:two-component system, sensor histidine kinase and response regulator
VHCLSVEDNSDNGEPKGMIMTQNITERNKMIVEIKSTSESLKKFSYAIENIPSIVVITNPEGKIEYVNNRFTEITGYQLEEVIGKNPRILKSGKQKLEFYKNLWEKVKSGDMWIGNFPNKNKNGEIYWEHAKIAPIYNEAGEIIHFVKVSEEITAKVVAKEEMIEHNKRIEQLINESLDNMSKEEIREFMKKELSTHEKIVNVLEW